MRVWSRSGTSMIGKPERFGVATPRPCSVSRIRAVMAWRWPRRASPRRSLTSKPARTVASDATGDGPEYRYGGGGALHRALTSLGGGGDAPRHEERLRKTP